MTALEVELAALHHELEECRRRVAERDRRIRQALTFWYDRPRNSFDETANRMVDALKEDRGAGHLSDLQLRIDAAVVALTADEVWLTGREDDHWFAWNICLGFTRRTIRILKEGPR